MPLRVSCPGPLLRLACFGGGRSGPGSPLLGFWLLGWRQGVPRGGAFYRCEGRLGSCAPSPPTARPLGGLSGSAIHVLWPRACGCGGPALSPRPAHPVGAARHGAGPWRSCAGGRAGGGGGACAVPPGCAAGGGPVGRGVAVPHSVPLPSLGRQQSGCHWRCAVHGGRGPPYHSGSCSPGFSGYDLCGVLARRRGLACSPRPPWEPAAGAGGRVALRLLSRAGGGPSPLPGGMGAGAPAACGPVGGRGGGGVEPRPPCSPSGRRPAVLNPGPLRVAGALPSGVRVRSGSKCRPGVGGGEGRPVDRSPGGPCRPEPPSALPVWAVVTGGSCGARPPYCSVVRVAPARQCGLAGAGPAATPPTASPSLLGGGAPPAPGGRRAAPVAPQLGGVGGPPRRPLSGLSGRGGGELGGPSGPLATPPDGRGGGAAWQSRPRGPAIGWGVAPFPRPPLPRARPSCRPSLGPLIPQAVVARRWPAGGGHEG